MMSGRVARELVLAVKTVNIYDLGILSEILSSQPVLAT